jgi:glycerol-3-phosphate acyltransferase PlsY
MMKIFTGVGMFTSIDIGLIVFAYLIGSVNCAIIVCKLMGLPSPLTVGSGNPGATNVLRLGSKKAAAITLLGDAVKGVIPVVIGHILHESVLVLSLIALAAVIGHIFPLFFKFKGGKGVATTFGVVIALSPLLGLCALITWLVIAAIFRYSSLAALVTCILTPAYAYYLLGPESLWPLVVMVLIVIIRHHSNIRRLLNGTESKIGKKVKAAA